jgi:hypothetical protein
MSTQGITTSFSVDKDPKEVFDAINDVGGWWAGDIAGSADKRGRVHLPLQNLRSAESRVTNSFPAKGELARSGRLPEFREGQGRRRWHKIVFDIAKRVKRTEVRFTTRDWVHITMLSGCSSAWSSLINGSLPNGATGDVRRKSHEASAMLNQAASTLCP